MMLRSLLRATPFVLLAGLSAATLTRADDSATHHGLDLAGMDRSVAPTVDFFRFANGEWLTKTKIPADRPAVAIFTELQDRNRKILHQILEEAARDTHAPKDSITGKVGAFYRSGMNTAAIEKAGAQPLQPEFERVNTIADTNGLVQELARLHADQVGVAFRFAPRPDFQDSKHMAAWLYQGGLGLSDRDYYFKTDDKTKGIRAAYLAHIEKMLTLLGEPRDQAASHAKTVLNFETRLAKASRKRVALRDPKANYHPMTLEEVEAVAPAMPWKLYLASLGLSDLQKINVGQPEFVKEIGSMMATVPLDDWKTYLRWHLLSSYADSLSSPFEKEDFHFRSTVLSGVPKMRPRWERVLQATDRALGEALGQLYVARAFPPEAKAKADKLVHNLKAVLRQRLEHLDWMASATRAQALRKLDAMAIKIGYPSKWKDYTGLAVNHPVYVENVLASAEFEHQRNLHKIGKPVDRSEWHMTPPTVNAYYNASANEIVFPAGILQPPFFDPKADDAVNYGGIGAVIGHEMTHGFDDQGRQFDADGNLRDWWTPQDAKVYKARAEQIAKQYDGYSPLEHLHVNGHLTLGENIADLGGVKVAYLALQKALQGKHPAKIDGFTPEQRFFIAYGQIWRFKARSEMQRIRLMTDPHSPPRFRVQGPLYNMPQFFEAFGVTPAEAGDRLNPKPVQIW